MTSKKSEKKSELRALTQPRTIPKKILLAASNYNTKLRQFILSTLQNTKSPLSSLELHSQAAESGIDCNRSTIYRQLEKLKVEDLILELDFLDGKKRYELNTNSHHHHLICTICTRSFCIDIAESPLLELTTKPAKALQFKIKSHILEFFGECKDCQEI